jgi:starch-binding outer membrane protein, SusD/RagB family
MRNIYKNYKLHLTVLLLITGLTTGCEDYLDQAPESIITDQDAFSTFFSFQGFVEELYSCHTDYFNSGGYKDISGVDETIYTPPSFWDTGDYWNQGGFLYGNTPNTDGRNVYVKRVWPLAWYGIRKANMALEKLPLMIDATQEERNFVEGQALFFRGWFYFELMRWWGGMPYITEVLHPAGDLKLPRLNYRETALMAAKDFEAAANLLPVNWDQSEAGKRTLGHNGQRITKIHALSYLGKNLLFAASPMMNEESTGNNFYDVDLAKRSAEAFAKAIETSSTSGRYMLQSWATWTDNFWFLSPDRRVINGGTEGIMIPPGYAANQIRWAGSPYRAPSTFNSGSAYVETPTHNFVQRYRMANGLPIDHPDSGYDPADPWSNREARFYVDITVDGDEIVRLSSSGADQYAQLYRGGRHRVGVGGSPTGYYYKKWAPKGTDKWENYWNRIYVSPPFLRLADVYLMYAEAVLHGYGSPTSSVPGSITAIDAVNVIRNRAQLPDVPAEFTATKEAFWEELVRERTVELAFEGHRFHDLRRWNISGNPEFLQKTAIDFDRDTDGKPINMQERVIITRVFDKKHNWLPIYRQFVNLYEEFNQNPGW